MRDWRWRLVAALVVAITLVLPACGGSENDESSGEAAKTAGAGFGKDYAAEAGAFDLASIGQTVA